jgi:hypothetical protein
MKTHKNWANGLLVVVVTLGLSLPALPAWGWGAEGHNAIALIAQRHLSHRAERRVTRLLDGYNMAYWSAWADGLRDDKRYDAFATWHYANVDEGYTYATSPKNPTGDVYTAVNECIAQLESPSASDSLKTLYLKLLIHFVGDMHCPMHAGRTYDRGGNGYEVRFFGDRTSLHRLWDSELVDAARPWTGLEWSLNIDRPISRAERLAIVGTGPEAWMEQTAVLSHELYAATPEGENLAWPYINHWSPVVERKFLEAGYRLASLLNAIF